MTGPAQIGVSGGRTSGKLLHDILQAHEGKLPDYVRPLFENTGKEREETLIFIKEMDERWGVKIFMLEYCRVWGQPDELDHYKMVDFDTASRNGEPFMMMIEYYKNYRREMKDLGPILPNPTNRMCTAYLKIKIAESHMRKLGFLSWDQVAGIRYDEPRRYHRMMKANQVRNNHYDNLCPMYESGVIKEHVNEFWSRQPFDLGIDSDLGNCDLCFLKHESKNMRALKENPELGKWWADLESSTGQVFRMDRPNYQQLMFYANQMNKQQLLDFDGEDLADCMCGD
jgi:3'-phosphoadenosine 5'-phosphosulfate sulfotransferase (PAPS reductase)/FAD synthetase